MRNDGWSGPEDPERLELPNLIVRTALFSAFGDRRDYYAIADEVELVEDGRVGMVTLDCVSVDHFWNTLSANRALFQVLENYHNAATRIEVENRRQLLGAMLRVEAGDLREGIITRCAVLLFCPRDDLKELTEAFPPGAWRRVRLETEGMPALLTIPKEVDKLTAVVTRDLHDDETLVAASFDPRGEVSRLERNFLEEVFSLNHRPDAPFDGGESTLLPPPAAPIILAEGAFSIDGDEEFWRGQECGPIHVADEKISRYPKPGKAYCRATKKEYDVLNAYVPGPAPPSFGYEPLALMSAESVHHRLFLSGRDGPAYEIELQGERLIVSVYHQPPPRSPYGNIYRGDPSSRAWEGHGKKMV